MAIEKLLEKYNGKETPLINNSIISNSTIIINEQKKKGWFGSVVAKITTWLAAS